MLVNASPLKYCNSLKVSVNLRTWAPPNELFPIFTLLMPLAGLSLLYLLQVSSWGSTSVSCWPASWGGDEQVIAVCTKEVLRNCHSQSALQSQMKSLPATLPKSQSLWKEKQERPQRLLVIHGCATEWSDTLYLVPIFIPTSIIPPQHKVEWKYGLGCKARCVRDVIRTYVHTYLTCHNKLSGQRWAHQVIPIHSSKCGATMEGRACKWYH